MSEDNGSPPDALQAGESGGDEASEGYLTGQLLIAMPGMPDPRFSRAVLYMCAHSAEGAMGLMINRTFDDLSLGELLPQLGIEAGDEAAAIEVHEGGPVEPARGFVLHSQDYVGEGTMLLDDGLALTATIDILRAIARGQGPARYILALGYAGWDAGQLDAELQDNGWLAAPVDPELVFARDDEAKWHKAIQQLGIDPSLLSGTAGRA